MTAKETKIRESWIAEIGEEKYNDIGEKIDADGWVKYTYQKELNIPHSESKFQYYWSSANSDRHSFRPKSINGIGNNNGWLSINIDGLPSENGVYCFGCLEDSGFKILGETKYDINNITLNPKITHYRKKEVYPPPIY